MIMSGFIEVKNDITELKQYPAIHQIFELGKTIIKNGVDHGYDSPESEISYGGKTYEMDIFKVNRSKSVNVFEIFDYYLKKKKIAVIYSTYKELLDYGITFEQKIKQTDIAGYSLKTRKQTRNIIF